MTAPDTTAMMDAAVTLAEAGWPVFPLKPLTKDPHGLLAPNGHLNATGNLDTIRRWWTRSPDANIGIAVPDGMVVVDIDPRNGGDVTWAELSGGATITTTTSISGRGDGGFHLWLQHPGGDLFGKLGPGVDVKEGGKGYIVAAPSIHPDSGEPYRWLEDGADIAEAPPWLVDLIVKPDAPAVAPTTPTATSSGTAVSKANYDGLPGTDYNTRHTWAELLTADGWTPVKGKPDHWTRPPIASDATQKTGTSATTNYNGNDLLTVFTSSVPALDPDTTYSRFTYYAATRHNGDLTAAYHALLGLGYGNDPDDLSWIPDTAAGQIAADPPQPTAPPPVRDRFVDGATFILDGPTDVPAIWGDSDQVLWASGEPCIITGPPGVGKTTLVGQIVAGRLGLSIWPVLGLPIVKGRRVLYLASDRPQQIRRSLARQFTGNDRAELAERLTVWTGPPPGDFAKNPKMLAEMCAQADADTVVIDSLKDVAIGLSDDEVGAGLNSAIQEAIANDVEVLALHHQRKGTNGTKPRTLEDVYGSRWITAGAGSVVLLWGAAGDLVVEMLHLKQPADTVGPWKIEHDHDRGITTIADGNFDLLTWMRSQSEWVTATTTARAMTGNPAPNDNTVRQARRKLDRLVTAGHARKVEAVTGGPTGTQPARYQPTKEVA